MSEHATYFASNVQTAHPALGEGQQRLCIEMEYCSLGSLESLLRTAQDAESGAAASSSPNSSAQKKFARKLASGPDLRLSIARQ
eukprot:scaffold248549_cov35-Prasinocladus_malaysianus.AAC.1